jgi:predicted transposase YdaD
MQAWEERYYDKLDARLEGKIEGKLEGEIEGKRVGEIKGRIASTLELLEDLGPVPDELKTQLESIDDLTILKQLLQVAAKADSIEQFKATMDELL